MDRKIGSFFTAWRHGRYRTLMTCADINSVNFPAFLAHQATLSDAGHKLRHDTEFYKWKHHITASSQVRGNPDFQEAHLPENVAIEVAIRAWPLSAREGDPIYGETTTPRPLSLGQRLLRSSFCCFCRSLGRPPEIEDFSYYHPVIGYTPADLTLPIRRAAARRDFERNKIFTELRGVRTTDQPSSTIRQQARGMALPLRFRGRLHTG